MKSHKKATNEAVKDVYETLLERFGEPIGSYSATLIGVPDQRDGECDQEAGCCDECGNMLPLEGLTCEGCGMMVTEANYEDYLLGLDKDENSLDNMDESKPLVNRPKPDKGGKDSMKLGLEADDQMDELDESEPLINRPKKDKGKDSMKLGLEGDGELDEKTPPGGEKVVKALKKQKGVKNPWAVAWSMKKKGEF